MSSGSLQVKGDLGVWTAKTANNALMVGQSAATIRFVLKVNSASGLSFPGNVLTSTNIASNFFLRIGGAPTGEIAIKCSNANMIWQGTLTPGKVFDFLVSINAVGASNIWLNGVLVVGPATNIGTTNATAGGIQIGYDTSGQPADFYLANFAIWNGHALGQSSAVSLRDGVTTPATEAIQATSWWTLQGTAAANPVASADGLLDQIGSNHFITLPGSGGSTTNAVYSSTQVAYFPALALDQVYVSRNQLVTFITGTNPNNGTVTPSAATAINTPPTISINGTPTTPSALSPIWPANGGGNPSIHYHFTQTIAPTDVITWSTVDGWVSNALGTAGPASGTAANYVGQLEPPSFGYLPFDLPDNKKTLKVGFNGNGGEQGESAILKNIIHRIGPFQGAATWTSSFFPLTIGPTGSCVQTLWNSGDNNGVDGLAYPTPVGTWVFIGDERVPLSPMTLALSCGAAGMVTLVGITPGVIDPGTGFEMGKKWTWTVAHNAGQSWNLNLQLTLTTHANVAGTNTLQNFRVFEPGNAPDPNVGAFTVNDNIVRMLNPAKGVYSPVLRMMEALTGSDGGCSKVFPADFRPASDFSYYSPPSATFSINDNSTDWTTATPTITVSRQIRIYETRPYNLTTSPKIYLATNYLRSSPSTDFAGYAFEFLPGAQSPPMLYDWPHPTNFLGLGNNSSCVIEFFCGDNAGNPLNHNLQSGQVVKLSNFSSTACSNVNGSGTLTLNGFIGAVWVTSPNTFICVVASTLSVSPNLGIATGTQIQSGTTPIHSGIAQGGTLTTITFDTGAVSSNGSYFQQLVVITSGTGAGQSMQVAAYTGATRVATMLNPWTIAPDSTSHFDIRPLALASIEVPAGDRGYPIEAIGSIPATLTGTAIWVAIPHGISDAGALSYATRLFNSSPRGTIFYVEYSNEILIPNAQFLWLLNLTALEFGGGAGVTMAQAAVQRMSEIHAIFTSVWGSDAGSLRRVFQVFTLGPLGTHDGLTYAQQQHIPIDVLSFAPYVDMDTSAPTQMAAASICWDDSASIANTANGGPGIPFSMAAYHDVCRHHIKYNQIYNGPNGLFAQHFNYIGSTGYGAGSGGFTYPFPKIASYETNFWTPIPPGVSLTQKVIRAALTHDFMYHPEYYYTTHTFLQSQQQPGTAGTVGFDSVCIENLTFIRETGDLFVTCPDGNDNGFAAISGVYLGEQMVAGMGLSNQFAGFGGATPTLTAKDAVNQSISGQVYNEWMIAAASNNSGPPQTAYFTVSPSRIRPGHSSPITLRLSGVLTSWTSGSTVTVTNSIKGTTTVTKGTWTQTSATTGTLTVTTGTGNGNWKLTIDGIDSALLAVGPDRRKWFSAMSARRYR